MPRWQHSLLALLFLLPTLSFVWADEPVPLALPDSAPGRILRGWLSAHNAADPPALQAWMESAYGPSLLARVDRDAHLQWYVEAVEMFGPMVPQPHFILESTALKLVVHLRSTEVASDSSPDPAKVLVVEIDMDPEDSGHLSRGLGLGPLVCEAPGRH